MKALSEEAPVQSSPVPVQSDSLPEPPSLSLVRTSPLCWGSGRLGKGEETWECEDIMCFIPWNSL